MSRGRYSLLGLGHPRSQWFTEVARWTTSGVLSIDFAKCVSAVEIKHRLSGLQRFSAVLIEAGIQGVDRDLLDVVHNAGAAPIIVRTAASDVDWIELGATLVLDAPLSPPALMDALITHSTLISTYADVASDDSTPIAFDRGTVVTICGPGGTGASTQAIALAQGLASQGSVVLCDFARNSEQAVLHDATERAPSVDDLIDANRMRKAAVDEVRALTFDVESRGYRLLLGQRRMGTWSAMPPRAITSAINALRRSFDFVVIDVTADFESEIEGGSIDVEERNALARSAVREANTVVVVGNPGIKGVHALGRTIREVQGSGAIDVVPVVNKAPRRGLGRLSITRALSSVCTTNIAPIFVPVVDPERALQDVMPLPDKLVSPISSAVRATLERESLPLSPSDELLRVAPGSLGLLDASN